ncbi:MAG: hypothetical protein LBD58_10905 [Treponema sp.]|jgi:hypothetical protein|nr:hypothetical protein [Treponema sp.]
MRNKMPVFCFCADPKRLLALLCEIGLNGIKLSLRNFKQYFKCKNSIKGTSKNCRTAVAFLEVPLCLFMNMLHYHTKKERAKLNITETNDIYYGFRFRHLSQEAAMILAESLKIKNGVELRKQGCNRYGASSRFILSCLCLSVNSLPYLLPPRRLNPQP